MAALEVQVMNPPDDTTALGLMGMQAQKQIEHDENLATETLITTALAIAQMVVYWALYDDVRDKRDSAIDRELAFMDQLQALKAQDDVILNAKADSLNIPVPDADVCGEASNYTDDCMSDGAAVDETSLRLSKSCCAGIPDGWGLHDGSLYGALGAASAGPFMAGNSKRRQEQFIVKKAQIVRAGQQGMKSVYKAADILAYYQQEVGIYQGLADIFIGGFNSAGAALGVAVGRMSTAFSSGPAPASGSAGTTFSGSSGIDTSSIA